MVLVARDRGRLGALAKDLDAEWGVACEVLAADLTEPDQLAAVEARVEDSERPIEILVNNAGFGTFGRFDRLQRDIEEREILLNVTALVRLTHAAVEAMIPRGRGAVLNVSSVAGFQPTPRNATYGATKAFVTSFSQALHEELKGTGVTVTVVCPGYTRTEFQERAGLDMSGIPEFLWQNAHEVAEIALAGLRKGKAVVVPGGWNRALVSVASVLPDVATRKVAATVVRRFRR